MTPFAALRALAGLTNGEAAELLETREQQAKDMSTGRKRTPPGIISELRQLIERQERAAAEVLAAAERDNAAVLYLHCPADHAEALGLGWPSVGAWGAMAARVIMASPRPVAFGPLDAPAPADARSPSKLG